MSARSPFALVLRVPRVLRVVLMLLLLLPCLPVAAAPLPAQPASPALPASPAWSGISCEAARVEAASALEAAYQREPVRAAQGLRRVVEQGFESAALWHDLGTLYLQLGDLPRARISLERCRMLAPRDGRFAASCAALDQRLSAHHLEPLGSWRPRGTAWITSFTQEEWCLAEAAGWGGCIVALGLLALVRSQPARWAVRLPGTNSLTRAAITAGVLGGLCQLAVFAHPCRLAGDIGSVLVEHAALHALPGREAAEQGEVPAGERVRVLERAQHWCRVETPSRGTGWLQADELELMPSPRAGQGEPS